MSKGGEYRFRIDGFTPDTLPMARLAEYIADLAVIFGEKELVHFVGIEKGSAILIQKIDAVAAPKVLERINQVRLGDGPPDAMNAYNRTNKRLRQDNCTGQLTKDDGAEIIHFPGRAEKKPIAFGAFNQDGTLDGKVIVIGGKGDPVPIHLEQGDTIHHCIASRDIAKGLGRHLFIDEVRAHGTGRWLRTEDGNWSMERFTIKSFEILDDQPLSSVVALLRDVPGNGWRDVENPWDELMSLRDNSEETH
ncbi:MAG: hypothetical protein HOK21_21330 [Rhodospirillaceae bacterium]|jgi:hypothetical protein|nr:hypothetical protein [Rhodospirillaceae bacterium]MBT4042363.1 hypothetical protein [Rhodospirillaceae bacterium]MBT4690562.1 hypothetical protein [Rhodospirillaceae bacterium]MBT5083877.1 hypothetical protein [Rhodospirillaceae bacterium]MBT5526637.1 hypothetical protein [Rhodospirillaceae bacterium]